MGTTHDNPSGHAPPQRPGRIGARDSWLVRGSLWLYRHCLLAYPASFRRTFAIELLQVFRLCCRDALQTGGYGALARLWLVTLMDLVVSALAERLIGGYTMASSRMSRFGGLVVMVGGGFWLAVSALALAAEFSSSFAPMDQWTTVATDFVYGVPFAVIWVLFFVGLAGLTAQVRASVSGWLRGGAILAGAGACLGALLLLVGGVVTGALENYLGLVALGVLPNSISVVQYGILTGSIFNAFSWVASVGYPTVGIGLAALGVITLSRRALWRWSALCLLMGVVAVGAFFISEPVAIIWLTTSLSGFETWIIATMLFDLFWGACWLLLGVALLRRSRAREVGAVERHSALHLPSDGREVVGAGGGV